MDILSGKKFVVRGLCTLRRLRVRRAHAGAGLVTQKGKLASTLLLRARSVTPRVRELLSAWQRAMRSWFAPVVKRRFGFIAPMTVAIGCATASLIVFGPKADKSPENLWNLMRILLQITSLILGVNVIGVTINTNQFGQAAAIRKLIADIDELAGSLFWPLSIAHPKLRPPYIRGTREDYARRRLFIGYLVRATAIGNLVFRRAHKNDFYVFRPWWDGVWYQTEKSPFANVEPQGKRVEVETIHHVALCAFSVLHYVSEMRAANCCLLSPTRRPISMGVRWFLDDLQKLQENLGVSLAKVPDSLSVADSSALINIALEAAHYLYQELREQSDNSNWQPHQITHFSCYFLECITWIGYLWCYIQLLREQRLHFHRGISVEAMSATTLSKMRMGVKEIRPKILQLSVAAKAEYGVASRFWLIRQAAKPGIGWAVGFLACAGLGWPLVLTTGSHAAMVTVFAIIYALGLTAFLESLLFASKLTWGQKTPEPLARIGSNPAH